MIIITETKHGEKQLELIDDSSALRIALSLEHDNDAYASGTHTATTQKKSRRDKVGNTKPQRRPVGGG
ncbi:MAG: hypothetical protein F6K28_10975 [Microcoleus sp. SIO2G3]|nr:hypothetical protein [Microcoleus sp. SIO2G3]